MRCFWIWLNLPGQEPRLWRFRTINVFYLNWTQLCQYWRVWYIHCQLLSLSPQQGVHQFVNQPFCTKWAHEYGGFRKELCRDVKEGRVEIILTGKDDHEKRKADLDREKRTRREAIRRARKRAKKLAAAAAALRDNNSE
jgi:hypothetical protein